MTRNFTVEDAVERWLRERKPDVAESTLYNNRSSLRIFIKYCNSQGVENIENIDAFLIDDFRLHRYDQVSDNTVYNDLSTVKPFIRWCQSRELISHDIAQDIVLPERENKARDEMIEPERAREILDYLKKYEYATMRHALFALLWDTGIRIGAARSLDVNHFSKKGKFIELQHRPDQDLPLKNKTASERDVNIHEWVAEIIHDYTRTRRNQYEDEHGNLPLFTTDAGRAHRTTLRKHITSLTRPCFYTNECPHDREINGCEATQYNKACKCPSSVSPHPIRRSSITYWLDEGHSKELLSERMDVSVKRLEEHYDARSKEQKRELRRDMLDFESNRDSM